MSDVFAEIDEAMRQEKLAAFWHAHKALIITFIAATIIGTALISAYRAWDLHVKTAQTETVLQMLEASDYPANIQAETTLKLRPSLRGITLMNAASAFMEQDKRDEALALYRRASLDKAIPADLRDLATLMSLRLAAPEAEEALTQLRVIMNNKKSPWRYPAHIEAATLLAHGQQDYAGALEILGIVQDTPDIAPTLYQKAEALSHVYRLKQKKAEQ